jgi:hypothetical protein
MGSEVLFGEARKRKSYQKVRNGRNHRRMGLKNGVGRNEEFGTVAPQTLADAKQKGGREQYEAVG